MQSNNFKAANMTESEKNAKAAKRFLILILGMFLASSCVVDVPETVFYSDASGSSFSASNRIYIDLTEEKVSEDNSSWSKITTVSTDFFSGTVKVKFTQDDAENSTGVIRLDAEGAVENLAVYLTGTQTSGGFKIQTSTEYETGLYLNGVSITSTDYPCIDITKGGAATVFVSGTNILKDGRVYNSDYSTSGSDNKGTLFCKGSLALCGDGTLTVSQNYKSCIASKGNILLEGGIYTLSSTGAAVYDSTEADYNSPALINCDGNFNVKGGTVTGTASGNGGKGVKVDGNYIQSAGFIDVKATGSNVGSSSSSGNGAGKPGQSSSSSDSPSAAAKGVRVAGTITVSGGKLYATSKNNEAIESKSTITITGGEVYGYSTGDDAINSASTMTISGGYVCGYSSANDGLDANGNMYIKGGLVYAVCTTTPEVALDANTEGGYKLYIQGGTVIAIGPVEGGASLSQSCYKASNWSSNTTYGLTVGNTTYTFKTPSSTSGYGSGIIVSGSSTPSLTSGATAGSSTYFDGLVSSGGTKGSSSVSLSSYTSSSSMGGGSMGPKW